MCIQLQVNSIKLIFLSKLHFQEIMCQKLFFETKTIESRNKFQMQTF